MDDERLPVAQIGPHSFVLREPRSTRRGYATIVIRINGEEQEHGVILGVADPTETEVAYA